MLLPPNGLELSCPAARGTLLPLYGNLAGNSSSNFPHASRVSCSELLAGAGLRRDDKPGNWPNLPCNAAQEGRNGRAVEREEIESAPAADGERCMSR